jgi:hypothetical protein
MLLHLIINLVLACMQGTAMASLVHMQRILANRQLHFPSVEKAVRCGFFLDTQFGLWGKAYIWMSRMRVFSGVL